jgi:hypothetical protein
MKIWGWQAPKHSQPFSMAWHSPEGIWFKQRAEEVGFKQAVAERDSGDPIPGSKK